MSGRRIIVAMGLFLGLVSCAIPSRAPVTGIIGVHSITTSLDHAIAEEALADISASQPPRHSSVARALLNTELPGFEELHTLSRETSPDTATLVLIDRISRIETHRQMQTLYDSYLHRLRQWSRSGFSVIAACLRGAELPELHFVPGWYYARNPWTGADFAAQRRLFAEFGVKTALIAVGENESVEANAQIVARHIGELKTNQRVILVSTSKGGPETAHALGALVDESSTAAILAWVSIGGVLLGSPLADMAETFPTSLLAQLMYWRDDVESSHSVASLTSEQSTARFLKQRLPAHIRVFNYVGVPMSGHVSANAQSGYRLLRRFGPNDGLTPLTHQWSHGGKIVLDVGLDHFYQDMDIDLKTAAMAFAVFESIGITQARLCVRPNAEPER